MLFKQNLSGVYFSKISPVGQNFSWCLVIAVHMFSCYYTEKYQEREIYYHAIYTEDTGVSFQKKFLRKLPWCFYLSYQMCAAYITIQLHINYRVSFHICLPQWLKLPRCLYLNYQVYGVNVIVLFTEITGGGFNKFIANDQSYHDA